MYDVTYVYHTPNVFVWNVLNPFQRTMFADIHDIIDRRAFDSTLHHHRLNFLRCRFFLVKKLRIFTALYFSLFPRFHSCEKACRVYCLDKRFSCKLQGNVCKMSLSAFISCSCSQSAHAITLRCMRQ